MSSNRIFWGIVFVLAGAIILLANFGLLPADAWGVLWPLFIVLLGIKLLLDALFRRPVHASELESVSVPAGDATSAHVVIAHGAGRLDVRAGADEGTLLDGTFSGGVSHRQSRDGGDLTVELRAPAGDDSSAWMPWNWGPHGALDWSIRMNRSIPTTLEVGAGANNAVLDLSDLTVTSLQLKTGASSTTVTLPAAAGHTKATVKTGAASVQLIVPGGVAARIKTQGGLGSMNIDATRFPGSGNNYESPDFETAANKVEIAIESGVASIQVA